MPIGSFNAISPIMKREEEINDWNRVHRAAGKIKEMSKCYWDDMIYSSFPADGRLRLMLEQELFR